MRNEVLTREESARRYFAVEGFNCAQSVAAAFADLMGLDLRTVIHMSASFGGGMGRMREICGTVSGALLVLGVLYAPDDPTDRAAKAAHYARVQTFMKRFREGQGTYVCRELLGGAASTDPMPEARTAQYYSTRPCERIVGYSAALLEEMIAEEEAKRSALHALESEEKS